MDLYDSDQVRDQLGGEIVDHYSPLGVLVLSAKPARSVIVENLTCFHEAVLIIIIFKLPQHFSLSQLQTAIRGGLAPDYRRVCMCNLMCVAGRVTRLMTNQLMYLAIGMGTSRGSSTCPTFIRSACGVGSGFFSLS